MKELLFYSKCRPQGCDAWPVAREYGRVFVGYPVHAGLDGKADVAGAVGRDRAVHRRSPVDLGIVNALTRAR